MRNLIKICTKCHSKRSHVVAKSKNLLSSWCSKAAIGAFVFGALLVACGDDNSGKNAGGTEEDSGIVAIADKTVSGVSQKGPFVNGSSVTVQELDGESLAQTGGSFEGKIKNDMGEFSVKVKNLESQYALLKANGFYRNEVTGEKSKSQVTLYALTDLSDRDEVNVNLLTHMEYERSLYLAAEGLSVGKAKKQAESEVLASFGIEGDFASAEDLSIFGTDDGAAALLAVSVLMQGDLSEADFSERLANYAADIEQDGKWDDFITATVIADWASNRSLTGALAAIRNNIAGWGLAADVPAFEKYVDRYWWQVYSLGFCDKDREGEVKAADNALSKNSGVHFICGDGAWRKATDVEYDTYEKKCDEDGKIVFGNVNKERPYDCDGNSWRKATEVEGVLGGCVESRFDEVAEALESHYICESRQWRKATDIEKDTFGWKDSTDSAIKKGNVTDAMYVYDKDSWRTASDVEAKLGGCVEAIADSVGKIDRDYYICKSKKWLEATPLEYDTYHWAAGKDGDSKAGDVNEENCYVYESKAWRSGNASDCSLKLRGCTALRQDTVGLGSDKIWYICDKQDWRRATDIEKDTATWGAGAFDGEVRAGQINKTLYYIYEANKKAWRNATTLEKDTYDYINNIDWVDGEEGETRKGAVTDSMYVYDDSLWRQISLLEEKYNSTCTNKLEGKVVQTDSVGCLDCTFISWNSIVTNWRICKQGSWQVASDDEIFGVCKATRISELINIGSKKNPAYRQCQNGSTEYSWSNISINPTMGCSKNQEGEDFPFTYGALKCVDKHLVPIISYIELDNNLCNEYAVGAIIEWNSMKFQCSKFNTKTSAYQFEDYRWNRVKEYGELIDERDGRKYKTINIGKQIWMAENLNFDYQIDGESYGSSCFDDDLTNCEKYGRLYTWAAAMDSAALYDDASAGCGYGVSCDVIKDVARGVCPQGWHIPSENDFMHLLNLNISIKLGAYKSWYGGGVDALLLKSSEGWVNDSNGIDMWGFDGQPVGWFDSDRSEYREISYFTAYWRAEGESNYGGRLYLERSDYTGVGTSENKKSKLSVRCIKDEE